MQGTRNVASIRRAVSLHERVLGYGGRSSAKGEVSGALLLPALRGTAAWKYRYRSEQRKVKVRTAEREENGDLRAERIHACNCQRKSCVAI
jgi:hypothetical protein